MVIHLEVSTKCCKVVEKGLQRRVQDRVGIYL
jgi:hypothetical protein